MSCSAVPQTSWMPGTAGPAFRRPLGRVPWRPSGPDDRSDAAHAWRIHGPPGLAGRRRTVPTAGCGSRHMAAGDHASALGAGVLPYVSVLVPALVGNPGPHVSHG